MRAVIDIGSNSILLLVGRRGPGGRLTIVRDEARIARISEGAAESGQLDPAAIERALAILREYRSLADGVPVCAVATEGLRMASNKDEFLLPAQEILGGPVELISGSREAELSYRSVALEHDQPGVLRVIDIGGASTELVSGHGLEIESVVSHPIGSVRLTERLVHEDPPSRSSIDAVAQTARDAFAGQPLEPAAELHGLAGTVTTCAALLLGLERYDRDRVHGSRFAAGEIRALRDSLAAQPQAQRASRPCLPPGRADVIVAGLTILLAAMEHSGAGHLSVRDRGLRYALL